jgi:predicted permease
MSALSRLSSWWRAWRDRVRLDRQLREELEFHVDRCAEDLVRDGLSPDLARQRARAALGSMTATSEDVRAALGLRLADEIRGDLRYALRMLRRSPAFTVVAVLSLGLGIGANTAIFSLIDTVLLKPLPLSRPDRLFFVDSSGGRSGHSGPPYPAFEIMRERSRYFSSLAAVASNGFRVTIDGVTERIRGAHASGQFFDVLQLTASHGRLFTSDDDAQIGGGGRDGAVAVISDALWRRRFAADLAVLGKTIEVGTRPVTIIGILPPHFQGLQAGYRFDLILPFVLAPNDLRARESWWFQAIGRLKDETSVEQAQAELDAIWQTYMNDNRVGEGVRRGFPNIVLTSARRGLGELRRDFAEPLWIVMGIVGLVLAIGCANVANLLVARASARHHELGLRHAIGAGTGRLLRQMLVEGLLLSALGAALGLVIAAAGVQVLVGLLAGAHQRVLLEPAFDIRLFGFTATVAGLTGLLFSLVPALHSLRAGPSALRDGERVSQSRPRLRAGQAFAAVQVMLSIVLLFGAALFVRTLVNLKSVDTGFTAAGVTTITVDAVLPPAPPPDRPEQFAAERAGIGQMWQRLADRIGALPGVESAAVGALTPFSGAVRGVRLVVVGPAAERDSGIRLNQVTPTYFETFRMRIVKGRPFRPEDRAGSAKVVILNQSAARHHFGEADPIGRRVLLPKPGESGEHDVIGIVADVHYESLRHEPSRMAYVPLGQAFDRIGRPAIVVRAAVDMTALITAIRTEIRELIPGGLVGDIVSVSHEVDGALLRERLVSLLATVFGALALILACIGLYGVLSYSVVRRTREIGIRVAIGARPAGVAWLVLRETVVVVACGVAFGVPVALWVAHFVERQLFDVTSRDPLAIAGAMLSLLIVGAIAALIPARRASRIDPIQALRSE